MGIARLFQAVTKKEKKMATGLRVGDVVVINQSGRTNSIQVVKGDEGTVTSVNGGPDVTVNFYRGMQGMYTIATRMLDRVGEKSECDVNLSDIKEPANDIEKEALKEALADYDKEKKDSMKKGYKALLKDLIKNAKASTEITTKVKKQGKVLGLSEEDIKKLIAE